MKYTSTIGLEIHAEIKTESKVWCGCKNNPCESKSNTHICPVCLGYPGAMPFINERAIEQILRLGVALEGDLANYTQFDRKHYFYPDMPKGYQISQHMFPLVSNATLNNIEITRIHLEEDTARSEYNEEGSTLLDFNRSGVPLLELVTEPVIHSANEAVIFAREFQQVLQVLEVSDARMERGEMRVEANISISNTDTLGTKVEVKNLNSFRSVKSAIEYETQRHQGMLEKGEKIQQQTLGFNESRGTTFVRRSKEILQEYRYAPEPDLPPLKISLNPKWSKETLLKKIPELPNVTRKRYKKYIPKEQIEILLANKQRKMLFEKTIEGIDQAHIPLVSNYITNDISSYEESDEARNLYIHITPQALRELIALIVDKSISSRGAKNILSYMVKHGGAPKVIAETKGLFQQTDINTLTALVKKVVNENPDAVSDYKKGKVSALQFFVGCVMKETKGSANPQETRRIIDIFLRQ